MAKIGRPTLYTDAVIGIADDYIAKTPFPTVAGLSILLGHHKQIILDWADRNPLFHDAIKRLKSVQEDRLVNAALGNKYNCTFSIFFAKNNLGYRDFQEVKTTAVEEEDVTLLKEEIARLTAKLGL